MPSGSKIRHFDLLCAQIYSKYYSLAKYSIFLDTSCTWVTCGLATFPYGFACDKSCVYMHVRCCRPFWNQFYQTFYQPEKCIVMGSSWYFDETADDPGQSSLDNISFNGQLVNAVGRMIYAGKRFCEQPPLILRLQTIDLLCAS